MGKKGNAIKKQKSQKQGEKQVLTKSTKKKYMNLSEFAEHIGGSPTLMTKYKKAGYFGDALIQDSPRKFRVDVKKAIKNLDKKLSPVNRQKIKPAKPKNKTAKEKTKSKTNPKIKSGKKSKTKSEKPDQKQAIRQAGFEDLDFSEARTKNEQYKASLKKLEFEEKSSVLVPADEVKQIWSQHIQSAKTRLLGMKSKIAPIIQEVIEDIEARETVLSSVDACVYEALEELSRGDGDI